MHMADALLSPIVAITMFASTTVVAGYSVKKLNKENDNKKIPIMGIMGAFVFASQMINFTIPGTGSSGHISGAFLLAALLGPEAAFLTMISVLLIQCLIFADGGLLALGANIWNMAFYGCFVGYYLIYKPIMKNGITNKKLVITSIIGCVLALELGAFSVTIQTTLSNITELPFKLFVSTMLPIHIAIGLVEGLITQAVLIFINNTRPELLKLNTNLNNRFSFKKAAIVIVSTTIIIASGLSLAASSLPDGLEYSVQTVLNDDELINPNSNIYDTTTNIQQTTSLLPDYENTSFSGFVGVSIILLLSGFVSIVIKRKGLIKVNE